MKMVTRRKKVRVSCNDLCIVVSQSEWDNLVILARLIDASGHRPKSVPYPFLEMAAIAEQLVGGLTRHSDELQILIGAAAGVYEQEFNCYHNITRYEELELTDGIETFDLSDVEWRITKDTVNLLRHHFPARAFHLVAEEDVKNMLELLQNATGMNTKPALAAIEAAWNIPAGES